MGASERGRFSPLLDGGWGRGLIAAQRVLLWNGSSDRVLTNKAIESELGAVQEMGEEDAREGVRGAPGLRERFCQHRHRPERLPSNCPFCEN